MASPRPPEPVTVEAVLERAYWRLFWGQALALVGTGVATVALALVAYQLVGRDAAAIFGTLLALERGTHVLLTPLAAALVRRLPRGPLLVGLDLARAALLLALPFVPTVAGLFLVVLAFQVCSAVFVPAAQAVTSDLLPQEQDYLAALARSRLAYELEQVASPAVAGLLLFVLEAPALFDVAAVAFVASAALLARAGFPEGRNAGREGGAAVGGARPADLSRGAAAARSRGAEPGRGGPYRDGHRGDRPSGPRRARRQRADDDRGTRRGRRRLGGGRTPGPAPDRSAAAARHHARRRRPGRPGSAPGRRRARLRNAPAPLAGARPRRLPGGHPGRDAAARARPAGRQARPLRHPTSHSPTPP